MRLVSPPVLWLSIALFAGPALAAIRPPQASDGATSAAELASPAKSGSGRTATAGALPRRSAEGGYLSAGHVPDAAPMLGPPPPAGSGAAKGDVAIYEETRALQGTPRWALATRDAVYGADALMQDFSCALGVQLTAKNAPALQHLLSRVVVDSEAVQRRAKDAYKRPRPFVDHPGAICVTKEPWLAKSYSYPSGHSTFSWTVGLILAQAAPEKATEILARARVYGESRVVCGVHYESDVQAGRIAASAVFSALQAEPEFQRDLRAVRAELTALSASGGAAPDGEECRIEDDAVAHPAW